MLDHNYNRMDAREINKIKKYQNLDKVMKKPWKTKTKIVLVIIGVFNTAFKLLFTKLKYVGIEIHTDDPC